MNLVGQIDNELEISHSVWAKEGAYLDFETSENVGGCEMPVDRTKIVQMEKALAEARAQLWKEEAERLRILLRDISKEEKERIMGGLTDKQERILFGLELPEAAAGAPGGERPGKSGGDMVCEICGKSGLTKRGLGLHMVRRHKEAKAEEGEGDVPFERSGRP